MFQTFLCPFSKLPLLSLFLLLFLFFGVSPSFKSFALLSPGCFSSLRYIYPPQSFLPLCCSLLQIVACVELISKILSSSINVLCVCVFALSVCCMWHAACALSFCEFGQLLVSTSHTARNRIHIRGFVQRFFLFVQLTNALATHSLENDTVAQTAQSLDSCKLQQNYPNSSIHLHSKIASSSSSCICFFQCIHNYFAQVTQLPFWQCCLNLLNRALLS